jgi:hypothetical protein
LSTGRRLILYAMAWIGLVIVLASLLAQALA